MRIISGIYGGLNIDSPKGHVAHPMSEKMRGAIFNSLGDISDCTVLDAFSGSGAMALEAISRGAEHVVAIEQNMTVYKTLAKNIKRIDVQNIKAIRANCSSWSDNNPDIKFDYIICDPPYDKLSINLIAKLAKHLKPNASMILSYSGRQAVPDIDGIVVVNNRNYGDAAFASYHLAS